MTNLEQAIRLIGGRIAVCFLAGSEENAQEVWEAGRGAAIPTIEAHCLADMAAVTESVRRLTAVVPVVSVALSGGADPGQWEKVLAGGQAGVHHLNQPFSTAGHVKGAVSRCWVNGAVSRCWVNGVVAPTGTPGHVGLETLNGRGPVLGAGEAARLLKDAGVDALKFHPAKGTELIEETVAACAATNSAGLSGLRARRRGEPGQSAVPHQSLPADRDSYLPAHVFGSVIEKSTGKTKPQAVQAIITALESLFQ